MYPILNIDFSYYSSFCFRYSTCKISHLSLPELLQPCSETDSSLTSSTSHTKEMADLLLQNKCCSLEKDSDSSQNSELNRISVDFQSFMRDRNLSQGKGGYDKNIGVTVCMLLPYKTIFSLFRFRNRS